MPYQSNFRLHPEKPMLVSATVFAANLDVISFYNDKLKIIVVRLKFSEVFEGMLMDI